MRCFLLPIFLFCQLLSVEEELKEFAEKEIPLEAPEADKNFSQPYPQSLRFCQRDLWQRGGARDTR